MCQIEESMEFGFLYPLGKKRKKRKEKNLFSEENIVCNHHNFCDLKTSVE